MSICIPVNYISFCKKNICTHFKGQCVRSGGKSAPLRNRHYSSGDTLSYRHGAGLRGPFQYISHWINSIRERSGGPQPVGFFVGRFAFGRRSDAMWCWWLVNESLPKYKIQGLYGSLFTIINTFMEIAIQLHLTELGSWDPILYCAKPLPKLMTPFCQRALHKTEWDFRILSLYENEFQYIFCNMSPNVSNLYTRLIQGSLTQSPNLEDVRLDVNVRLKFDWYGENLQFDNIDSSVHGFTNPVYKSIMT